MNLETMLVVTTERNAKVPFTLFVMPLLYFIVGPRTERNLNLGLG